MVNKTSLLKSNEVHIKDGLNLYIPTVGEVLHNEQGYYSLATSLTASPKSFMVQLDDAGKDYTTISEWDLFCMLFQQLSEQARMLVLHKLTMERIQEQFDENSQEYRKCQEGMKKYDNQLSDLCTDLIFGNTDIAGFELREEEGKKYFYNVTTDLTITEEDYKEIADVIELYLKNDQYNVLKFYTGQEALDCIASTKIDLAILDIMLPDVDGFQILKQIREKYTFPVIMLTAKTEYMDKITGLTLGADDYIPKPFNPLELVARVKAQIRRYTQYNEGTKDEGDVIDFGGLFLNRQSHECTYNEVPLTLTPIEFDILWLLCENRGKVISSEELFHKVWKEECYKNSNNTVMVHIRHLREKMNGPTGKSDFIKTVWGVGYKVEE